MALQPGDTAPAFSVTLKTADGLKQFALEDNLGKKNTVLLFFPMAFTGVCTQEFCDLSQGLNDYTSLDAEVIGVSGDNPFAQEAWAKKENITVPLGSDYEHKVAAAYGVAYDSFLPEVGLPMGGVSKRSAFLIDKTGVIRFADVKDHPKDLPDFAKLKEALAALS